VEETVVSSGRPVVHPTRKAIHRIATERSLIGFNIKTHPFKIYGVSANDDIGGGDLFLRVHKTGDGVVSYITDLNRNQRKHAYSEWKNF
jgi:hypothetical protein